MTPRTNPHAIALIRIFALAWPLGVYAGTPFTSLDLLHLLTILLAALFLAEIRGRPRIPFELFWPAVLVPALCAVHWLQTGAPVDYSLVVAFALFLMVHHFMRDRESALACMRLSAISGVCAAGLTVAGWLELTLPTAHPTPGPIEVERLASVFRFSTLSFARDIPHGMATLAICGAACAHFSIASSNRYRRAAWALGAVIAIGALAGPCLWLFMAPGSSPHRSWFAPVSSTMAAIAITGIWFVARIAAKLIVDRAENGVVAKSPFLWVIAAVIPLVMLFPVHARPEHLFVLGLAAAFTRARDRAPGTPGYLPWAFAAVAAVAAVNLLHVFPANGSDPRNYALRTRSDIRAGRRDLAWNRIALIERWRPQERTTHLLRAGILLDLGYPNWAAEEFREACRTPAGKLILPPASEEELEAFVTRLRDYCSGIPLDRRGFAYESALTARGRGDTAFPLLFGAGVESESPGAGRADAALFAAALSDLLGDKSLSEQLAARGTAELLRAMDARGARVQPLPTSHAGGHGPIIIIVQRISGGVSIRAHGIDESYDATIHGAPSFPWHIESRWLDAELVPREAGGLQADIRFTEGTFLGRMALDVVHAELLSIDEHIFKVPDTPGVFIWLP